MISTQSLTSHVGKSLGWLNTDVDMLSGLLSGRIDVTGFFGVTLDGKSGMFQ